MIYIYRDVLLLQLVNVLNVVNESVYLQNVLNAKINSSERLCAAINLVVVE